MSLRKFMHPRNKYKIPPNFKELATIYPEFREHIFIDLTGKLRFNFKNEESLRVLTKVLLKHDFDLNVEIPIEKLVPAIPLRLNYVLWIEDLMKYAGITKVSGIDIGTGAVCIYPLLCAKINGWKMIGTEIDPSSVKSALKNIHHNNLDQLISVVHVNEQCILKDVIVGADTYSFTICNPPFYNLDKSDKKEKISPARNAETGNKTELTVDGGESSFVKRMIDESIELADKVIVYTSMLGVKKNLIQCQCELKRRNIENVAWTEFCQGHTKRWGLAWSFLPKNQLNLTTAPVIQTKICNPNNNRLKNNSSELVVPLIDKFPTIVDVITQLKKWFHELKIDINELSKKNVECDNWMCELIAKENTWSHARRKRRMAMQKDENKFKKLCLEMDEMTNDKEMESTSSCSVNNELLNDKEPYLQLNLIIGKLNIDTEQIKFSDANEEIKICMIYQSGTGGKNALETFKQYLINKFDIRVHIQQWKKKTHMN